MCAYMTKTLYFTWRQKIGVLMPASTKPHLSVFFTSIKNVRIDPGGVNWVEQETFRLPEEVTNPNLIQEDKNAVQESILAQV